MNVSNSTFILRLGVAIILLMHSLPGILDNSVTEFGRSYLAQNGFGVLGIPLAWVIKLSHVAVAICLLLEKYLSWACWLTIIILVVGIVMLHRHEGWYVVGGGRNGVEFNFILIVALLAILFPNGIAWNKIFSSNK